MPVSSAILSPKDKEVVIHDGFIHCEGFVSTSVICPPPVLISFSCVAGLTAEVVTGLKELKSPLMEVSFGMR